MKLCNEIPRVHSKLAYETIRCHTSDQTISVPRSHGVHPSDTMPEESYDDIRRLISRLLPGLVGREIIDGKICWCTGNGSPKQKSHRSAA
jgi:sarcosine oxidase / L-pipecolate oxidase